MYDVKVLEEQWKQYNKNKKKPYYAAFAAIAILVISVSMYMVKQDIFSPSSTVAPTVMAESSSDEKSVVLLDSPIAMVQEKEKIESIKPTVKVALETPMVEDVPTLPIVDAIPILDEKPKIAKQKPKIAISKTQAMIKKPRKKMHLNIVESSSVSAYKDVERRFYESHDTDDSLFLAKSYFRKGNYSKSEFWALQTNKVNSNIEESWIIFAKSKVKLGRRNEAIRILTNYVKRSHSSVANNLLNTLKNN